jgi:hypothetical protein
MIANGEALQDHQRRIVNAALNWARAECTAKKTGQSPDAHPDRSRVATLSAMKHRLFNAIRAAAAHFPCFEVEGLDRRSAAGDRRRAGE